MYVKVVKDNDFSEKEIFQSIVHNMLDHLIENDFSINEDGTVED
jgi:hypothetical protein